MSKINLPNLNQTVIKALNYFKKGKTKELKKELKIVNNKDLILAVGSVNALSTAKMLLADRPAIYADESNLKTILKIHQNLIRKKIIKQAIIISASGEKDAIWEIKEIKKYKLKTHLLTCNLQAGAAKLADKTSYFSKISEPYSYNFSTYLSMLLSTYPEDLNKLIKYLNNLKKPKNFNDYKFFSFILPDKYRVIADMIKVKDDEMFAAKSTIRAFSFGQARHAKFIYQDKHELVISFGKNRYFGWPKNRWEISINKSMNYVSILALSYYLVGLIQEQKPDYFKKSLADYCLNRGPKPYQGKNSFKIIIPGNDN